MIEISEPYLLFRPGFRHRESTKGIITHHIGILPTSVDIQDIGIEMVHDWHRAQGWLGAGYHLLIKADERATVELGRPLWAEGSHCSGRNGDYLGVCVVGNFSAHNPLPQQIDRLAEVYHYLCKKYPAITPENIKGHRDFKATECPGDNLYSWLPCVIKKAVLLNGC